MAESEGGGTVEYRRPPNGEPMCWPLEAADPFTFGRSADCDLVLDSADRSISSVAGRLRSVAGVWLLENRSRYATLEIIGDCDTRWMPPSTGSEEIIHDADIIVVPSRGWRHELTCRLPAERRGSTTPIETGTVELSDVSLSLSAGQRQVLTALVIGWLVPQRFDPIPLSASEIAALLRADGITAKGAARRLETIREKVGRSIGRPVVSNYDLAEIARHHRLVTRRDALELLGVDA